MIITLNVPIGFRLDNGNFPYENYCTGFFPKWSLLLCTFNIGLELWWYKVFQDQVGSDFISLGLSFKKKKKTEPELISFIYLVIFFFLLGEKGKEKIYLCFYVIAIYMILLLFQMFFEDNIDDAKYCGHLYGLGPSYVMNGNATLEEASPIPTTSTSWQLLI